MFAVGMQFGGQNAGGVGRFEHHGTRPVAKQHAGGAVVKVQNAAKYFRPNNQGALGRAGFDHAVGHGERVHKAAAHRLHVKGGATSDGFGVGWQGNIRYIINSCLRTIYAGCSRILHRKCQFMLQNGRR